MIIGRQLVDEYYEDERLYSTGDDYLDDLLEKAFCDGYEYAQKEFGKLVGTAKANVGNFFKGGNKAVNKVANKTSLISAQANKLKNQGKPQFISENFKTVKNPEYEPSNLLKSARDGNKELYGGKYAPAKSAQAPRKMASLDKLSRQQGASIDQAINAKRLGRGSIGSYRKEAGSIRYDHGVRDNK